MLAGSDEEGFVAVLSCQERIRAPGRCSGGDTGRLKTVGVADSGLLALCWGWVIIQHVDVCSPFLQDTGHACNWEG